MIDKQTEFLEKLKILQQKFINSLAERLQHLKQHEQYLLSDWNAENLQQCYIDIHTLAGSGATFGFNELSQTAKLVEDKIQPFLQSEDVPALIQKQAVESAFLLLETVLNKIISQSQTVFPLANENVSIIAEDCQQEEQVSNNKYILLIEDDKILANNIAEQIQVFGYQVTVLHDSHDIHQSLLTKIPCALIVDIILPEGNNAGTEAIKKIRNDYEHSLPRNMPIIFISCRTDVEARLSAVKAGGSAYLTKPLDINNLIECLDKLINQPPEKYYRILIVDDDKELAEHYALILESAGMLPRICNEPANMLQEMEDNRPDLVLMDLYMPNYKGYELASIIRQIDAYVAVPIVYLSSEHSSELQIQALLQGGDDFLVKPIRPETLIRIVSYKAERFYNLRSLMSKDGLTGLYNHRHIKDHIRNEVTRAEREQTRVSLAMFDVDYFKKVNDTYGHSGGDQVLKTLARFLIDRIRKTDLVGRYGGEEFVIVFPNTSIENATKLCKKLCSDFEKVRHSYNNNYFYVTFSGGIASYPLFDNPQSLADAADKALYISKNNGRNQITIASL